MVAARAEFENRPIADLYRSTLRPRIEAAIGRHVAAPEASPLPSLIDALAAESIRDVDAILVGGFRAGAKDAEGDLWFQRQVIDGVEYAQRAGAARARELRVSLPARLEGGGIELPNAPGVPRLPAGAAPFLRARLAPNADELSAPGRFDLDAGRLIFSLAVEPYTFGHLEGTIDLDGHRGLPLRGYVFAVPSDHELLDHPEAGGCTSRGPSPAPRQRRSAEGPGADGRRVRPRPEVPAGTAALSRVP